MVTETAIELPFPLAGPQHAFIYYLIPIFLTRLRTYFNVHAA